MEKETKILLGIIAVIVAGLIGVFVMFNKTGTSTTSDATKLVRNDSQKQGSGSVTMVEFGDYQCPSCGVAHSTVKKLMKEYNGKVTFVFRNFPLETIHKNAMISAKYAEASARQGKFWEMHDKLFESQSEWSELSDPTAKFAEYAKALGMDVEALKNAAADGVISGIIQRDMTDGDELGVTGTPTFFVNGKQVANNDYASLKSAIDAAQ